jgi:hypothetical protein
MSQERLNGLVILSIEQDLLENIEYKSLISNFVTKIVCRLIFQNFFFLKIEGLIFLHRPRPHNSQDRP